MISHLLMASIPYSIEGAEKLLPMHANATTQHTPGTWGGGGELSAPPSNGDLVL